jgi:hypothetical protein
MYTLNIINQLYAIQEEINISLQTASACIKRHANDGRVHAVTSTDLKFKARRYLLAFSSCQAECLIKSKTEKKYNVSTDDVWKSGSILGHIFLLCQS